ncbi:hypothetical protein [Dyella jejuensis]
MADKGRSEVGNMMMGIAAGGATSGLGGAGAIGEFAAEAYGGIQTGSLWQFALATRTGTALTSGAVNWGVQLVKNGGDLSQTNYIDVGASLVGGYLGYGGNLAWNGLVGIGVGMTQTEANNLYYGKNDNLLVGGLTSGLTTMAGFKVGDVYTNWTMKPIFTSVGSVIAGNAAGTTSTELFNGIIEKYNKNIQQNNGSKQ